MDRFIIGLHLSLGLPCKCRWVKDNNQQTKECLILFLTEIIVNTSMNSNRFLIGPIRYLYFICIYYLKKWVQIESSKFDLAFQTLHVLI